MTSLIIPLRNSSFLLYYWQSLQTTIIPFWIIWLVIISIAHVKGKGKNISGYLDIINLVFLNVRHPFWVKNTGYRKGLKQTDNKRCLSLTIFIRKGRSSDFLLNFSFYRISAVKKIQRPLRSKLGTTLGGGN